MINSSRRGFPSRLAGVSLPSAGGFLTPHPRKPGQKVCRASVGIMDVLKHEAANAFVKPFICRGVEF